MDWSVLNSLGTIGCTCDADKNNGCVNDVPPVRYIHSVRSGLLMTSDNLVPPLAT